MNKNRLDFNSILSDNQEIRFLEETEDITKKKFVLLKDFFPTSGLAFSVEAGRIIALSIVRSNIDNLPDSLEILTSLKILLLSHNRLKILPDTFRRLISLERLDVNNNQLMSVTDTIGNLKSLKWLDLSNNCLQTLPESIGELESLENLHLSSNQLTSLPESLLKLKHLKSIGLNGNPDLQNLPNFPERVWLRI